ncbi:type II toxin-antitoxin system RelE/ParE family toxin [Roseateles sp. SL47]|uniref:type II toxin-antitoxin system RelE/ParE family toxin n=1 Tax=Roseateles sp. SL47 TaxID=2995138 RepID=UPI00226E4E6E|nr:type II toxin-antitoxin system RelE/ParE family toxin [Roseateles sp. SL47]WAC72793.1 type II toxin-antitoxin system RelE/ParE family toxin [Roseateles sp. SL47]
MVPFTVEELLRVPLVFYRSGTGAEPVRDWLKSLDRADRLAVGADLQRVQFRWPVGMPLCRSLGQGLWEVRTHLPSKTIARVLFCFHAEVLYALHGWIKKTQVTPADVLRLARDRMKEIQNG